MKKEEAILKINKLGNISNIIVRIMKIFLIIGLVFTVLGAIITMVLPKDLITMEMSATADIMVDVSSFGVTFTEEDKESFATGMYAGLTDEDEAEIQQMKMDVNGSVYEADEILVEDSAIGVRGTVDTYTVEFGDLCVILILAIIYCIIFKSVLSAHRFLAYFNVSSVRLFC